MEFTILITMMVFILVVFLGGISSKIYYDTEQQDLELLRQFSQGIADEMLSASQTERGFVRTVLLPPTIRGKEYMITFTEKQAGQTESSFITAWYPLARHPEDVIIQVPANVKGELNRVYDSLLVLKKQEGFLEVCLGCEAVLLLPLNEGGGANAQDLSDYGNDGALVGLVGPKWVGGRDESALEFNGAPGSPEYVTVPDSSSLDVEATDSVSVGAWVKTGTNNKNMRLVNKYDTTGVNPGWDIMIGGWFIPPADHKVYFYFQDDSGHLVEVKSGVDVNDVADNKWHHIVGIRDIETRKVYLYIDGVLDGSADDTTTGSGANGQPVIVGASNGGTAYFFDGIIDEVFIYKRALIPEEICVKAGKLWRSGICV